MRISDIISLTLDVAAVGTSRDHAVQKVESKELKRPFAGAPNETSRGAC